MVYCKLRDIQFSSCGSRQPPYSARYQLPWHSSGTFTGSYSTGQQVACVVYKGVDHGICASPQKLYKDEKISGAAVQKLFQDIINHGCKGCGSVPLRPGNNVNDGKSTVNYSNYTCQEGIYPSALRK
ncbi:killer toxin Kp4/SMK [Ampelomyces quisqualis]|uniref:Killer toxin Kp4/SMK n=1 Tax=Ampelomyces quisqualis TaxID=50730 RepID=A0A6A5Q832_AMPQU|nr:killer toxin Kp4/SMK [Ampelomyces quisqualis]